MQSGKTIDYSNKTPVSDTYSFDYLIEKDCLYVDKTEYLYNLVSSQKKLYFFSRPRRFGKSLTLSTLKAIFQGKKELFKGLYIDKQPYDWKKYPVIHLDLGSISASTSEKLEYLLLKKVLEIAEEYNIKLSVKYPEEAFEELIKKLSKRNGDVVVLIDEYDKPILNNIENENVAQLQKIMKGFYSVIKTCELYERFVFITGVGKFMKVSIFSDLNNLNDISMSDDYATMCGYTEKELKDYFDEKISDLAALHGIEYKDFLARVKKWYDGYKFSDGGENVYNPVSISKFLQDNGKFNNYWFETGTPSIIIKKIKDTKFDLSEIISNYNTEDIFSAFSPDDVSIIPLMYQTGYLTIKDVKYPDRKKSNDEQILYKLGFPNTEVEQSFFRRLLAGLNNENLIGDYLSIKLRKAVTEGKIDEFMSIMDTYLSNIPYDIQLKYEKYYQSIFFMIFRMIGCDIRAEERTDKGRIDAVLDTGDHIYVFEFKMNKSARIALKQIKENEYAKPYQHSGKPITIIGANYNFEKHKLTWKSAEI